MVEVEEIELDLALSIGGSSFKPSNSKPEARVSNSCDGVRVVEPCEKREIQALRRMEAKKKREQRRERVRETCEPEWEQDFKREKKTECRNGVSGAWMNNTTPFRVHHFATTVQYLPLNNNNNGFLLPCWVGGEKNVGGGGSGVDGVNNGLGGDTKVKSNGSSRCSSSVVSDYQSSSREDGGSTDSHSHSVHSLAEPTQMKNNNTSKEIGTTQPDQESASASSNSMMRPKQGTNNIITKKPQQQQPKPKQNPTTSPDPITTTTTMQSIDQKPLSNNENSMGKPPKPVISHHIISSLPPPQPQMPYVSTKGHNGKTVNGFLYRYTKSEVSIVCVCHGSTFSPAEFVQHAGGTDITHPLRHITVVPSSFG